MQLGRWYMYKKSCRGTEQVHVSEMKHQNITLNFKISQNKHITLLSNVSECSSPFESTAEGKVELITAHDQLHCSFNISLTLYQTDLSQRTQISVVTEAPFIQNSNRMTPSADQNCKFSKRIFSSPAVFKEISKFLAYRTALMTKIDLTFPAFS